MSKLAIAGITGSGGLGVLLVALLASSMLDLGVTGIVALLLLLYVMGGAAALILRSM